MVAREHQIAVYIMASRKHGTLYIGVTSQLTTRITAHREGRVPGFIKTYGCHRLVWFQGGESMGHAIQREKTMKKWPRQWKINLIERENPDWDDLYPALFQ